MAAEVRFRAIVFVLLAMVAIGCATPRDSGRLGLIDHLIRMDRENGGASKRATAQVEARRLSELKKLSSGWHWPLEKVAVTSQFGKRGRSMHEGIDLKARSGTPVQAAQDGKVLYAGNKIRGYGKLIVLQHASGMSSVYAHNSRLMVKTGQKVKKGQRIAKSGATGRASGPHVHFEIRDGETALDPVDILPSVHAWNSRKPERQLASKNRPGKDR